MRLVAISGGFDPIHIGHLHLMREAKQFGDSLLVILTRDDQLIRKKGYVFMPYQERKEVIENIKWVDRVVENIDHDISSCESLEIYSPNVYARGGDTLDKDHLLESRVCKELGIKIVVGVGGVKKEQSSSALAGKKKNGRKVVWAIDIDGKICSNEPIGKYELHQPNFDYIQRVNRHYEQGEIIKLFTARGSSSHIDWRDLTEKQLKEWGVKYHELIFKKPSFDFSDDDKNRELK